MAIELIMAAFKDSAYSITAATYPPTRYFTMLYGGDYDLVPMMSKKTSGFDLGLLESESIIGRDTSRFIVRKGDPWHFKDADSFVGKRLATTDLSTSFTGGPKPGKDALPWVHMVWFVENDYKTNNKKNISILAADGFMTQMLNMLVNDRVDVGWGTELGAAYVGRKMGILDKIEFREALLTSYDWILGINPALPEARQIKAAFDASMQKIIKNGTYARILAKYDVKDWR